MKLRRVHIQGIPDWPMRGHVTKQTKWPMHVYAQIWRAHFVVRRVTTQRRRVIGRSLGRHHNITAWPPKYGIGADVSRHRSPPQARSYVDERGRFS